MMKFKLSKPGFDVRNSQNINTTYSSDMASHSIFNILTVSTQNVDQEEVYHNLGYEPKVWIYQVLSDGGGTYYRRIPVFVAGVGSLDYTIDDEKVVIETDDSSVARVYKVIIFTRSPTV